MRSGNIQVLNWWKDRWASGASVECRDVKEFGGCRACGRVSAGRNIASVVLST